MSQLSAASHSLQQVANSAHNLPANVRPVLQVPAKQVRMENSRWKHLVAGGMGGMFGAILTCPLEVIKTRLQSKAQAVERRVGHGVLSIGTAILRNDGILGFWKGLGPMLAGVVPARAVYFAAYDFVKGTINEQRQSEDAATHLISAICAGATTNVLINPIWVIKTRMQLNSECASGAYRSTWQATLSIMREDGLGGFYRGLVPSLWGISESALQFVLYEDMKRRLLQRGNGEHLSQVECLAAASCSKFLACVATYPHEVIRTRMRERGADKIYRSAVHCLQKVWMEEGRRGLYGGMGVHLLRVVPNTAVLFLTYETVSRWLK